MRKLTAGGMTNKLKAKARVTLSALDMKKLILTNLPYLFIFLFADRASCLYRASPGADMGAGIAAVVKILVWQKQADAKKLRKGVEYGSARWGTAEDIKPFMADDFWMNIPLTSTESITMESRPKNPKYARNKNICVIGGSGSGKTRFFVKVSIMMMNCSMVITDPKGLIYKVQRNKRFFITKKRLFACIFKAFEERR